MGFIIYYCNIAIPTASKSNYLFASCLLYEDAMRQCNAADDSKPESHRRLSVSDAQSAMRCFAKIKSRTAAAICKVSRNWPGTIVLFVIISTSNMHYFLRKLLQKNVVSNAIRKLVERNFRKGVLGIYMPD